MSFDIIVGVLWCLRFVQFETCMIVSGTFQTMDKKPFKPVFNNPLKKSGVPTEREGGEWTQVQIMVMHFYF